VENLNEQEFENIISTWKANADKNFSSRKKLSQDELSAIEGYKKAISDLQLLIENNQNTAEYVNPLSTELMSQGLRSLAAMIALFGFFVIFSQGTEFRNTYLISFAIVVMITGVTLSQWKSGMNVRFPVYSIILGIFLYGAIFLAKENLAYTTTFANDVGIEIAGAAMVGLFFVFAIKKNRNGLWWLLTILILGVALAINISMLLVSSSNETFRVISLLGIEMVGTGYTALLLTIKSNAAA
jgi:hypothetical protein